MAWKKNIPGNKGAKLKLIERDDWLATTTLGLKLTKGLPENPKKLPEYVRVPKKLI